MDVCVIGWDGADWRILRPMMDAGVLPNLRALIQRSRHAALQSTLPPVTAPAWSTFLTGVNPGKHGLFTWQGPLNERLERPFLNASHVRAPRLWDWLTRAGKRSLFLNVPLTYPPPTFDGVLVGGMLTPGTHVNFTHPPEVREQLLRRMPDYQVDVEMQFTEKDRTSPSGMQSHLEEVRRTTVQRVNAWRFLLDAYGPFDLAMIVFEGTDRVQHPLYGYAANQRPADADPEWEERRKWVWEYYRFLDDQLAAVLSDCGEGTTVFFLSDHGFGPLYWEFCANEWLAEQGWLRFKGSAGRLYRPLRPLSRVAKRVLPASWVQRGKAAITGLKALDWSHTLAYSGGPMEDGIWLNVRGREPLGVIKAGDYEAVREEIMDALRSVTLPDGRPMCRAVYRREEVYSGPYVDQAADIILDLNEGVRFTSLRNPEGGVFRRVFPQGQGTHRRWGVFAVAGPSVLPGEFSTPPTMADLAPTILASMGIPLPDEHFDGHVLPEVVKSFQYGGAQEDEVGSTVAYSEEESRLIEEHLRSLGYIE